MPENETAQKLWILLQNACEIAYLAEARQFYLIKISGNFREKSSKVFWSQVVESSLRNIQIIVFIFILGDGEILEEIVSASRQKEINKAATLGDGNSFQSSLNSVLKQWMI